MTTIILSRQAVLLLITVLAAPVGYTQELPVAPAGDIQFYQSADSAFDVYTDAPTSAQQQWMRDHYLRIQGWSPYFDTRLAWYPDAWFYRNAYGLVPTSSVVAEHPDWVLKDSEGNNLFIPYACSGGTCPLFAGDFSNQDYRDWWIAAAQSSYFQGYRGIWIDDVNMTWRVSDGNGDHVTPFDVQTGAPMTLDNWRRYVAEFMEQVRATLPEAEISHNAIWYATDRTFTDPYLARQVDATNYVVLERGASDTGLVFGSGSFGFETFLAYIDFVHSRNRNVALLDESSNASQRDFALAGWFLISNGGDFMATENLNWSAPDRWWHGYDLTLGDQVSGRYTWNGVLRRDFACGSAFLNQPEAPLATLSLPDTYYTLSGDAVTSVTLGAREAALLLRGCRQPRPPTNLSSE